VDEEFWLDRWKTDRIGFHQEEINAALMDHAPRMPWPEGGRIFVPLCGKSEDMVWLRDHGQTVVGVELSPVAVRAFFDGHGEEFEVREAGPLRLYVGEDIEIFCGDVFKLDAGLLGEIDGVYDRAALVALPGSMRDAYARQMAALVPGGICTLLLTMEYGEGAMEGPPFSVAAEEVRALYGDAFEVELLEEGEFEPAPAKFAERGLGTSRDLVWSLIRNES
jgi:thiopurine S-methyltransferase